MLMLKFVQYTSVPIGLYSSDTGKEDGSQPLTINTRYAATRALYSRPTTVVQCQ